MCSGDSGAAIFGFNDVSNQPVCCNNGIERIVIEYTWPDFNVLASFNEIAFRKETV